MSVLGSGTQLNPGTSLYAFNSPGGSEFTSPVLVNPLATATSTATILTNKATSGILALGSSASNVSSLQLSDVAGVSKVDIFGDTPALVAGNSLRLSGSNAGNAYNIIANVGTATGLILSGAPGSTNITLTNGATSFNEDVAFNQPVSFTAQAPGYNPTLTTAQVLGTVGNITVPLTNPTQGAGVYLYSVGCATASYPDAPTAAVQVSAVGIWNGTRWVSGGSSSVPNASGLAYLSPNSTGIRLEFTNTGGNNLYPVVYKTQLAYFGGFTPA